MGGWRARGRLATSPAGRPPCGAGEVADGSGEVTNKAGALLSELPPTLGKLANAASELPAVWGGRVRANCRAVLGELANGARVYL
jgi:hypothetical protein